MPFPNEALRCTMRNERLSFFSLIKQEEEDFPP